MITIPALGLFVSALIGVLHSDATDVPSAAPETPTVEATEFSEAGSRVRRASQAGMATALLKADARAHDGHAREAFEATPKDDPMAYFHGMHYSSASCGLTRRLYLPKHNDVLVQHLDSKNLGARRAAAECISFRMPMTRRTVPIMIQIMRDADAQTASIAWEELEKHVNDGTVTYATSHERWGTVANEYEALWKRVKADWPKK